MNAAFDLARRVHEAPGPMAVVYAAGGGTEVFPWLLARGGGSATLLAGRIPYDPADFVAILGADPGRLVDARAARGLAMAAFRHALRLRPDLASGPGPGVVGVGATSKLATGPGERVGRAHEVHVALQAADRTIARSITLPPGGDRAAEERINALAILDLIAEARGLPGLDLAADGLVVDPAAVVAVRSDPAAAGCPDLPDLLTGRVAWVGRRLGPGAAGAAVPTGLVLPGSFRPLHEGHLRMARLASEREGRPCAFELSVTHPAKPPLDYVSIADRVEGFAGVDGWLLLTDAPTYLEKARLFPGSTFVVGHDTAVRITEPRWYGGVAARDAMLDELDDLGTRFLVFGRVDAAGRFRDLGAEEFAEPRVARFVARSARIVPEADFRLDVSSTLLRLRGDRDLP